MKTRLPDTALGLSASQGAACHLFPHHCALELHSSPSLCPKDTMAYSFFKAFANAPSFLEHSSPSLPRLAPTHSVLSWTAPQTVLQSLFKATLSKLFHALGHRKQFRPGMAQSNCPGWLLSHLPSWRLRGHYFHFSWKPPVRPQTTSWDALPLCPPISCTTVNLAF